MEDVAALLQQHLAEVSFADKDADEVTELLLTAAADWATAQGWRVYRKARSVFPLPPPYADKFSYVDLAFARHEQAPVVVEIDRTDRRRTVDKLLAEAQAGRVTIWIRWSDREIAEPPAPIQLVKVEVTGHKRRFSTPTPEKPAPEHSTVDLAAADQMDLF
jgi:hypothetical protein